MAFEGGGGVEGLKVPGEAMGGRRGGPVVVLPGLDGELEATPVEDGGEAGDAPPLVLELAGLGLEPVEGGGGVDEARPRLPDGAEPALGGVDPGVGGGGGGFEGVADGPSGGAGRATGGFSGFGGDRAAAAALPLIGLPAARFALGVVSLGRAGLFHEAVPLHLKAGGEVAPGAELKQWRGHGVYLVKRVAVRRSPTSWGS